MCSDRHRRTLLGALPIAAALVAGCPSNPSACKAAFVGSTDQPMIVVPFTLDVTGDAVVLREIHDGDPVTLVEPQQGGRVLYAGARLRNVDPCQVTMVGELQDPVDGHATSGRDSRQPDLEPAPPPNPNQLAQPNDLMSLVNVPNIPVCPDALGKGADDTDQILVITVTDRGGRTGSARVRVHTGCAVDDPACHCVCGADYHPGKCTPDLGALDAASDANPAPPDGAPVDAPAADGSSDR